MKTEVTLKVNLKTLKEFEKEFKRNLKIKAGIIHDSDNIRRETNMTTNYDIGKSHEFGEVVEINGRAVKLPERSWLRVPVMNHLMKYIRKNKELKDDKLLENMKKHGNEFLFQAIADATQQVIDDGFNSGGFGTWPPSNMSFKDVSITLIETEQLKQSVNVEVVEEE